LTYLNTITILKINTILFYITIIIIINYTGSGVA